jgi:putative FmdB family regulatory protein
MPFYIYECENNHRFDDLCPLDKRSDTVLCPVCGASCHRIPSQVSAKVIGGTPTFYPGRSGK